MVAVNEVTPIKSAEGDFFAVNKEFVKQSFYSVRNCENCACNCARFVRSKNLMHVLLQIFPLRHRLVD